jgi:ferredoxin
MPWIAEELCIGCGICVDECVTDAISMREGIAAIDDDGCIRCGICHDICAEEAIRHDGELVPEEVAANLAWARELLGHEYYRDSTERQAGLVERLGRHFANQRKVAQQTLDQLGTLLEQ